MQKLFRSTDAEPPCLQMGGLLGPLQYVPPASKIESDAILAIEPTCLTWRPACPGCVTKSMYIRSFLHSLYSLATWSGQLVRPSTGLALPPASYSKLHPGHHCSEST
eukprot:1150619-Pelagomonas_calceolata.AAC.7